MARISPIGGADGSLPRGLDGASSRVTLTDETPMLLWTQVRCPLWREAPRPTHCQPMKIEKLTREVFAPFGDLITLTGAQHYPINQGTTERFHDLALIDVSDQGGKPLISLFRGKSRILPFEIRMMERHPLGSQAFWP